MMMDGQDNQEAVHDHLNLVQNLYKNINVPLHIVYQADQVRIQDHNKIIRLHTYYHQVDPDLDLLNTGWILCPIIVDCDLAVT